MARDGKARAVTTWTSIKVGQACQDGAEKIIGIIMAKRTTTARETTSKLVPTHALTLPQIPSECGVPFNQERMNCVCKRYQIERWKYFGLRFLSAVQSVAQFTWQVQLAFHPRYDWD